MLSHRYLLVFLFTSVITSSAYSQRWGAPVWGPVRKVPDQLENRFLLVFNLEGPNAEPFYHYKTNRQLVPEWSYINGRFSTEQHLAEFPVMNFALQCRVSNRVAIEAGLQAGETGFKAHDQLFQSFHPDATDACVYMKGNAEANQGNFGFYRWYISPFTNVHYEILTNAGAGLYINAGISLNKYAAKNRAITMIYDDIASHERLEMTAHYADHYITPFVESGLGGIFTRNGNTHFLSVGVKYYFGGTVIRADYTRNEGGSLAYADHMSVDGSYLTATIRYGSPVLKRIKFHRKGGITRSRYRRPGSRHIKRGSGYIEREVEDSDNTKNPKH